MEKHEQINELVKLHFKEKGINIDEITLAYKSNLALKPVLTGETWICIADECLHIFSFLYEETSNVTRLFNRDKKENKEEKMILDDYHTYLLNEINKIEAHNQVNTGILVAKGKKKEFLLLRYTGAEKQKFNKITKLVNKVIEKGELIADDFKEKIRDDQCPECGKYYPDQTRQVCPNCMNKLSIFFRVLSYVKPYKKEITLILLLMIISSGLAMFPPYIGGVFFFDNVLTSGEPYYGRIGLAVFLMFATRLLALLLRIGVGRINAFFSASIIFNIKMEIFKAMQELSMSFFSNKQTGKLMSRINYDSMQLQYFFHDGIQEFLINCLLLIGISIILFYMNWLLALFVLVPIPLTIYIIRRLFPVLYRFFSKRFRKSAFLNSTINSALTGVRVVKAFGREDDEKEKFNQQNTDLFRINVKTGNLVSTVFPFLGFIMGIGSFFVWSVGGWQVLGDRLTFGQLMSFVGYTGMFYGPINFLSRVVDWWSYTMNSAQRIFEIIDARPEISQSPEAVSLPGIKGKVNINNISFSYIKTKPVLKEINLEVKPGEVIGFVGHSGAGKSTLTNLIARLYDVDEGSICIDGVDIRDIKIDDLRSQIGIVLQDTFLFKGTIAENILYAKPEADREEAIFAAKIANAHQFIMELPDGYDTMLGAKGQDLSGGEKQRLSIARAVLKNPRILILDEATASVDTKTELLIQEALERLIKGRTTFVIAHRLSTLRNADRLFILKNGKNVESGTHQELLKKKGVYYKLIQIQKKALKIQGV